MDSEPTLLKLACVCKKYDAVEGREALAVLQDISLELRRGESVAIVGPSGCGKSTLLNIIGTLDRPTSGKILLEGQDVSQLRDEDLADIRNRKIGFIFQAHHLLPQCTVLENVLLPVLARESVSGAEAASRARKLLERVGLGHRLGHRPGQLSGGECQRVAVVRALINQPRLLLADEPTGALDRHSAEGLGKLLMELNREQNVALVVVTHSAELAGQMRRKFELRDGRLAG